MTWLYPVFFSKPLRRFFLNVEKKSFEIRSSEFLHQVYFAFPTFQDQKIIYLFKMGGRGVNSGKEPYLSRPRNRNRRLSKSGNLPVQKVERSQHNESQFNVCIVEHIFVFVREDIKTCSKLQSQCIRTLLPWVREKWLMLPRYVDSNAA